MSCNIIVNEDYSVEFMRVSPMIPEPSERLLQSSLEIIKDCMSHVKSKD